jgi:hypothetical protein
MRDQSIYGAGVRAHRHDATIACVNGCKNTLMARSDARCMPQGNTLQFSVNGDKLGDAISGIEGPLVPALSVSSTTDCIVEIGKYRRFD